METILAIKLKVIIVASVAVPGSAAAGSALAATIALLLYFQGRRLRGTTLVLPWCWALASLLVIAAGECLVAWFAGDNGSPPWLSAMHLITATSTFCPLMAVLGARRPQHHAWQFVVLTMWIMLALPALESMFLGRLETMDVGPVRGWFLWLMLAVSWLAYGPTRFALASLLVTLGQALLLAPFLPGIGQRVAYHNGAVIALGLFMLAALATSARWPRARHTNNEFDRRWIQFRDMFGTMWALRVIERINTTARLHGWPLSLTWSGFYFHDDEQSWRTLSPQVEQELRQAMDNLMRRFM